MRVVGLIAALAAVVALSSPSQGAVPVDLTPLKNADEAIQNGVERLCPWFLAGQGYSISAAQNVAKSGGFWGGSSARFFPIGPSHEGASSAIGFSAQIAKAPPQGKGVVTFFGFDPAGCQVQVYGYEEELTSYLTTLVSKGWRLETTKPDTRGKITHDTYVGRPTGLDHDVTLIVNHWTDPVPDPGGLWAVINMVPRAPSAGHP